jgi:integrase
MGKTKKSVPIPVVVDGVQVGSLRLRYKTWQFRFRANGIHRDTTLRGVRDLEEALRRAKILAAQAPPIPTISSINLGKKPGTLENALDLYEDAYRNANRKTSLERTMPPLREWINWVGKGRPPYCLTRQHLIAWRDLRAQKVARTTVNSDVQRMKAYVNYLRAEGWVDGDPTFKVSKLKTNGTAKPAPSPEVVKKALEGFGTHWVHDFALSLANVGLRPQEGLHIRACDLEDDRPLLHVVSYPGWEIKDYENRTLALNDVAYKVLSKRKAATSNPEEVLFPSPTGITWDYRNFVNRIWKKLLPKGIKLSPYSLRHFFGTRAANEGNWEIYPLSVYMGHENTQTTERYYTDKRALKTGAPPITT